MNFKIDVTGNINFNWLNDYDTYKEIWKIIKPIFHSEELILNFGHTKYPEYSFLGVTKYKVMSGWEIETSLTYIYENQIKDIMKAFEGSIYRLSAIGINFDFMENDTRPNVCLIIDYTT